MTPGSFSSPGHSSHRLALPPGYDLEGFRIESVLGKGGFGLTYLATDTDLNFKVAIKELLPDGIATRVSGYTVVAQTESLAESWSWALRRFEEEARILAQLRHPNIVRVLRLIRAHGTAYMVMEYVEGRSLAEYLASRPMPSESELKALLMPILDGLEHVHQKRLLHRDISPENIFIARDGRPVLLDFGSARQDLGKTVSVTAVVRHGFSPFEQYQVKSHQGPYTDLYALAGVMALAMTGHKPPPATDRIADATVFAPLVTQCRGRYSETFCHAIESAFAVLPQNRPGSIPQFRQLLQGTTVLVPPRPDGDTTVRYPTAQNGKGASLAAWLGGGVFTCAASAAAIWWFGFALPERQATERGQANAAEMDRRTHDAAQEEIIRLRQKSAQAEAEAARLAEEKAEAERLARLAEEKAEAERLARLAQLKADEERRIREAALKRQQEEEERRIAQMEAEKAKSEARETRVAGLRNIIDSYVKSLNSSDASDYANLFAQWSYNVYYKGGGQAPRSFIQTDRQKYISEYPYRTYQVLNDGKFTWEFTNSDMSTAKATFTYSYNVSNNSKRRSGRAEVRLGLEWSGSGWHITSFDETVLRN